MKKQKMVLLLSGGLDSTTCLYWALHKGYEVEAIIFDYGQRHKKEVKTAVSNARSTGCVYHIVKMRFGWSAGALLNRKLPIKAGSSGKIPSTYVPGRNTVFLSYALSLCESIKGSGIIIGANQIDYSGYPDCRGKYLKAFERAAGLASGRNIKVLAPLLNMTKKEIVLASVKLGVPLEHTWSCYNGGAEPCNRCDSCRFRSRAFREAGLNDPLN